MPRDENVTVSWLHTEVAKWAPLHMDTRLKVQVEGNHGALATVVVQEVILTTDGPVLVVKI